MHMRSFFLGLISLWGLVNAATVTLRGTAVTGKDIPTLGQEFFAGIPYAEPPVGSRRLQAPALKTTLGSTTFNATSYGPSCIQSNANVQNVSEDCLTINVLRPVGINQNASLDVLVWVYGGGFSDGTASIYNGSAIVASSVLRGTPVIYINFNYRTGPLGFPQGTEAQQAGSLNLGLKDQLAALHWVQANIGAFGGDRRKVTVFGESAGAISIAIHMLRPTFKNLARATILESGSWGTTITNFASAHQADWDRFVAAVPSCAHRNQSASVRCLQQANLSAEVLQNATVAAGRSNTDQFPFIPTFDGTNGVYPTSGSVALKSGNWSKIPFITGCNKDEGTAFIPFPQFLTNDASQVWVKSNFTPPLVPFVGYQMLNASLSRLAQLYPNDPAAGAPFGTGNETFGFNPEFKRLAALTTDVSFHSQRRLFQKVATSQGVQSFGYHFIDPQPLPAFLGVTHGQEVNYVFGDCASKPLASQLLCQTMINYWLSFATSLTPNDGKGSVRVNWPAYTASSPDIIQLNGTNTTTVPDDYRKEQISYINNNTIVFHQRRSDDE